MQYTDNEAALIGGLISNYFFQPSVDETLRESYHRVLHHLHENTLSASDLSRIQNALASVLGVGIRQDQQKCQSKFYTLPRAKKSRFPEKTPEKRSKIACVKVQVH